MKMNRIVAMLGLLASAVMFHSQAMAQVVNGGGFFGQAVGGVSISTDGFLKMPITRDITLAREAQLKAMKPLPDALKSKVGMRMISLRAVEEAIAKSKDKNFSDVPQ